MASDASDSVSLVLEHSGAGRKGCWPCMCAALLFACPLVSSHVHATTSPISSDNVFTHVHALDSFNYSRLTKCSLGQEFNSSQQMLQNGTDNDKYKGVRYKKLSLYEVHHPQDFQLPQSPLHPLLRVFLSS